MLFRRISEVRMQFQSFYIFIFSSAFIVLFLFLPPLFPGYVYLFLSSWGPNNNELKEAETPIMWQ